MEHRRKGPHVHGKQDEVDGPTTVVVYWAMPAQRQCSARCYATCCLLASYRKHSDTHVRQENKSPSLVHVGRERRVADVAGTATIKGKNRHKRVGKIRMFVGLKVCSNLARKKRPRPHLVLNLEFWTGQERRRNQVKRTGNNRPRCAGRREIAPVDL